MQNKVVYVEKKMKTMVKADKNFIATKKKEGTNGFYSQFRLKIKATMEFISTVYMT